MCDRRDAEIVFTPTLGDTEEEAGRDGRVYLPSIVVQVSDATEAAVDAIDDELDTQLSSAINAFNTAPTTEGAGQVAGSAQDLSDALDDIAKPNTISNACGCV